LTDGAQVYKFVMPTKNQRESVGRSRRVYVRGDIHANTLVVFFSLFKRGLVGNYQHMDRMHFDRSWPSSISARTPAPSSASTTLSAALAVAGAKGKRLTYRRPDNEEEVAAQ
jgi:hypothetical protein